VKLRFAPSPTGYLHVGNAQIALINWLFARHGGGSFMLRLDDTDPGRSKPEFAAAIEQDLHWLGLDWDSFARQSDRLDRYAVAAERLKAAGRLYPCFESEEELKAKREMRLKRGQAPVYDRAMLKLTSEQRATAEAKGKRPYWRFLLTGRTVAWEDMIGGPRQVKLPAMSDPVLIREDGTPLYGFASVVDDLDMGVTHVIRGEDHVSNTGAQLDLWEALGGDPAAIRFGHLPLLLGSEGEKLSKRFEGLSLRVLARDGIEPGAITSYLARLGTADDPAPIPLGELARLFDITRISRSSPRFDIRQLLAMNRKLLHAMDFSDAAPHLPLGATPEFWQAVRGNLDLLSEARTWWEVVNGGIVPPVVEGESEFLRQSLQLLPPEPWGADVWNRWVDAVKAATGRRGKALFHPLRLALTGEEKGPELKELLPLMGRNLVAERLQIAAA
jgi:glutamyl-tRNA synthetase